MALTAQSAARKDRTTANGGPELQHRHFAFIAATFAECKPDPTWSAETDHWHTIVEHFADACAQSNGRFDRKRFLSACDYHR